MEINKQELEHILKDCIIEALNSIKLQKQRDKERDWNWTFEHHEKFPNMNILDNGLPSFYLSDYGKIDYSKFLFKDKKYLEFSSWTKYYNYVVNNKTLRQYFQLLEFSPLENPKEESLIFYNNLYTYYYLTDYVDSFIHLNNNSLEFNDKVFKLQFDEYFESITKEKLNIVLVVPILFLSFNFDEFVIDEKISIKRIDEQLQLARNHKKSYVSSAHDNVIGAATHAFFIENWTIPNNSQMAKETVLTEITSYKEPLVIIEKLFGALRLILDNETGFCQIISVPKGWNFRRKAELPEVFVASERNYPEKFENYGWIGAKPLMSKEKIESFATYYSKLNSKQFELPIKRLNAAVNRKTEEDSIIDITIALESLLTNDSTNEISYRLSVRVSQLCKLSKFKDLDAKKVFELCKKIYNYRSAVVHGDIKRIEKTRSLNITESKEIKIIDLSASLLRHLIKTMIENKIETINDIDQLMF